MPDSEPKPERPTKQQPRLWYPSEALRLELDALWAMLGGPHTPEWDSDEVDQSGFGGGAVA